MSELTDARLLDIFARRRDRVPSARLLGCEIIGVDHKAGIARARFLAQPEFCNPMGVIQGGFLVAMLDEVMAVAALAHAALDVQYPTLDLATRFLAPAKPGPLLGEGRVLRRGRQIAFLEGTLTDEAGLMLARASATAIGRPRTAPSAG